MGVFARYSSSLAVALAVFAAGCVEELPPVEGTTSLRIDVTSPADGGEPDDRLDDAARSLTFDVTALDAQGEVDVGFSGEADVFVHFLGSLTPELGDFPLASLQIVDGMASGIQVDLPPVYGPTFLWVEHTKGDAPTYATGTSDVLWFRDPYLEDISRPLDEMSLDALEASPLEDKQINVTQSRYANGRMVITGVYAQGYTMSDVQCADADGTPPCTSGAYDSLFVFSFNRPEDEEGRRVAAGQSVDRLTGSIGEFNGLTEVNFPQTFMSDTTVALDQIPDPVVIQTAWLSDVIEMERVEAALVAIDDATLCPLDDDFTTYSQWKLDIGQGCEDAINVITAGQVPDFVPADYVDQTMPRVVGTLRPVNIGSFNVWIIYPRSLGDITLP